jgi:hypothetical protein
VVQTRWKETLLRIVQEEEETITPDNKQLLEDMEEVRRLLRDDDSQRDEVRAYRKDKVFARLNVEKKIDDLRKFIVEELHCMLTHTHTHTHTERERERHNTHNTHTRTVFTINHIADDTTRAPPHTARNTTHAQSMRTSA